jgi:hypothetical protein
MPAAPLFIESVQRKSRRFVPVTSDLIPRSRAVIAILPWTSRPLIPDPEWKEDLMSKQFLNPLLKIVLCIIGLAVVGYYLLASSTSVNLTEPLTILRALVVIGFLYLLVQSVLDLFKKE